MSSVSTVCTVSDWSRPSCKSKKLRTRKSAASFGDAAAENDPDLLIDGWSSNRAIWKGIREQESVRGQRQPSACNSEPSPSSRSGR
eukprot:403164-Rhodomonas_salina.2